MRKHLWMGLAFFVAPNGIIRWLRMIINGAGYLTATETAKRLGVCDETIRRWVRLGRLPARKLGFQYFILERDVEEYTKAKAKSSL